MDGPSDIVSAQVSTKPISFTKVQSGWFFKEDRQELVGTYNANFYRWVSKIKEFESIFGKSL